MSRGFKAPYTGLIFLSCFFSSLLLFKAYAFANKLRCDRDKSIATIYFSTFKINTVVSGRLPQLCSFHLTHNRLTYVSHETKYIIIKYLLKDFYLVLLVRWMDTAVEMLVILITWRKKRSPLDAILSSMKLRWFFSLTKPLCAHLP